MKITVYSKINHIFYLISSFLKMKFHTVEHINEIGYVTIIICIILCWPILLKGIMPI